MIEKKTFAKKKFENSQFIPIFFSPIIIIIIFDCCLLLFVVVVVEYSEFCIFSEMLTHNNFIPLFVKYYFVVDQVCLEIESFFWTTTSTRKLAFEWTKLCFFSFSFFCCHFVSILC